MLKTSVIIIPSSKNKKSVEMITKEQKKMLRSFLL